MRLTDTWFSASERLEDVSDFDLLLFCGSFEKRCCAFPRLIDYGDADVHVLLTRPPAPDSGYAGMMEGNLISTVVAKSDHWHQHLISPSRPLETFSTLSPIFESMQSSGTILVDITTMPRELLGIVISLLGSAPIHENRVSFSYVPALSYDKNHPWESVWLSSGIKDIRAVIGFEGQSGPGETHLVLLNGFELERAKSIVTRIEPDSISLAHTAKSGSTHPKFAEVQAGVAGAIERYLDRELEYFDIFPKSSSQTYESLSTHVEVLRQRGTANILLAPLNTKPTSLATFLVALEQPDIQVIYAEPQVYNRDHYAEPQDGFYKISLA